VVCLGEALIDRLGPPGGDPAEDLPVDDRLGGAPANVACGLARLGTPVAFAGRLGQDAVGEAFSSLFSERGLDTSLLQRDAERPSRIVLVRRSRDGERQFQGFAGDKGAGFADQALEPALLPQARWLLIGTLPLAAPASASALLSAVRQARSQGTAIALDVNWRPTFWDVGADPSAGPSPSAVAAIRPLLEQAALIKLAREEAIWFFGSAHPQLISGTLPQAPDVVVTDGAEPVTWWMQGGSGSLPVFHPPEVVDTTGAGDAFTAGLLHCWDLPPLQRVSFAAGCGALVCGGAGGIDPQPSAPEVEAFIAEG
jgi:fructokinase